MADARRWLHALCTRLYFERVKLIGAEFLPSQGPVLYVSLHKNGAVDGLIERRVLRDPVFMIAARWTHGLSGLFFDGISVVRDKDAGDRAGNSQAMQRCVEHLRRGGELAIFPEGTSTLGPRHLPFKRGAARILSAYLSSDAKPIAVIPLTLCYEKAWAFRSKVEVVVGAPIDTRLAVDFAEEERVAELHARITRALEAVGTQHSDEREQALSEALAYAATLGTRRSYARSLKALEGGIPERLRRAWGELEESLAGRRVWRHQGVPLVPTRPVVLYALAFFVAAPLVLGAILFNLPPFAAGAWAGAKLSDERNVIALWRILVGVPLFLVWAPLAAVVTCVVAGPWAALGYACVTWLGLRSIFRAKRLAVALHNALVASSLRPKLLTLHRVVLETLPE